MIPQVFVEGAVYYANATGGDPLRCANCGHVIRTPEMLRINADRSATHFWPATPRLSVWQRVKRWWNVPPVIRRKVDRRQAALVADPCSQRYLSVMFRGV